MKLKRNLTIAVAAAVSTTLMVTSALAASENVSGYEKLQAASFALLSAENYTADFDMRISFDGETLIENRIEMKKQDKDNSYMKTTDKKGGRTSVVETSMNENSSSLSVVIDNEGKVNRITMPRTTSSASSVVNGITDTQKRLLQALMDMFVGDSKNYFTNKDGEISVKLEGKQIPEIAQLALAASVEQSQHMPSDIDRIMSYSIVTNENGLPEPATLHVTEGKPITIAEYDAVESSAAVLVETQMSVEQDYALFSKLVSDVMISEVQATAVLDDSGRVSSISGYCIFNGKDANGVSHTGRIDGVANVSNYGGTVAE